MLRAKRKGGRRFELTSRPSSSSPTTTVSKTRSSHQQRQHTLSDTSLPDLVNSKSPPSPMASSPSSPSFPSNPPRLVQPFDPSRATKGLRALSNISAGTQIHQEFATFVFEFGPGRRFHAGVDPWVFLCSLSPSEQLALVRIPPVPGNQDLISSRFYQCLPSAGGRNVDFIHLPLIGRANHSCV